MQNKLVVLTGMRNQIQYQKWAKVTIYMDLDIDAELTFRFEWDSETDQASKLAMVPTHLDPDL